MRITYLDFSSELTNTNKQIAEKVKKFAIQYNRLIKSTPSRERDAALKSITYQLKLNTRNIVNVSGKIEGIINVQNIETVPAETLSRGKARLENLLSEQEAGKTTISGQAKRFQHKRAKTRKWIKEHIKDAEHVRLTNDELDVLWDIINEMGDDNYDYKAVMGEYIALYKEKKQYSIEEFSDAIRDRIDARYYS